VCNSNERENKERNETGGPQEKLENGEKVVAPLLLQVRNN
jgi:hypothetical protein